MTKLSFDLFLVTSTAQHSSSSALRSVHSAQLRHPRWLETWRAKSRSWWSHRTLTSGRKPSCVRSGSFDVCLTSWKSSFRLPDRCWTKKIMVSVGGTYIKDDTKVFRSRNFDNWSYADHRDVREQSRYVKPFQKGETWVTSSLHRAWLKLDFDDDLIRLTPLWW